MCKKNIVGWTFSGIVQMQNSGQRCSFSSKTIMLKIELKNLSNLGMHEEFFLTQILMADLQTAVHHYWKQLFPPDRSDTESSDKLVQTS